MRASLQGSRKASHAGSWYTDDARKLDIQLSEWLQSALSSRQASCAVITPHAGYDYSAATAAFAFKQIDPSKVKRFFVLGPSHYLGMSGKCALSTVTFYDTPLCKLPIDGGVYEQLRKTREFLDLSLRDDEDEHSLEMQMPFIAKIMENYRGGLTIIPVVVGSLSPDREAVYGRIFAPYLSDPGNVFVISSDFCHWGRRFQYTRYDRSKGEIWQSIQAMDEEGMRAIESLSPAEFTSYLYQCGNTICGRHPIGILLQMVDILRKQSPSANVDFKFVKYAQSEHCHTIDQSSVSYAAGSLRIQL
ncbi:unnamed protein product [Calicophoron daubneyi]|uniref:Protein MEMO1 n=1 Tax=Calicophoron daubneyi TaxID=300641 RepID=A0AAV2T773_CALDB